MNTMIKLTFAIQLLGSVLTLSGGGTGSIGEAMVTRGMVTDAAATLQGGNHPYH